MSFSDAPLILTARSALGVISRPLNEGLDFCRESRTEPVIDKLVSIICSL